MGCIQPYRYTITNRSSKMQEKKTLKNIKLLFANLETRGFRQIHDKDGTSVKVLTQISLGVKNGNTP